MALYTFLPESRAAYRPSLGVASCGEFSSRPTAGGTVNCKFSKYKASCRVTFR